MFPYNDDNVVFTGISRMRNITCFKMGDDILTFFVTQLDTHPFVLAMPRFHTEWPEFDCHDFLGHH